MVELKTYSEELFNRILYATESNSTFSEEEFFNLTSELLGEAGVLDDIEYHPFKNKRKGLRMDGFSYNELERSINIIVIKYTNLSEPEVITQTEIDKLSKSAYRYLENIDNQNFLETLDETDPGRIVAESLSYKIADANKIRIIAITNNILSKRIKSVKIDPIREKNTTLEVWDLQRIRDIEESSSETEPFNVNFKSLCASGGLKALKATVEDNADVQSYLCVMPANVLSALFEEHGQRLLESNVRTFLDFRSNVNKGIRRSLLMEPNNVFAYNNGLTVTASGIKSKEKNGQVLIEELENMQIVNGGQTTASIYFSKKERGGIQEKLFSEIELEKISVQMKLSIILDEAKSEDMKSNISEYANTQNNIQAADLVSNHPFHKNIETLSRRMLMPAGETGIPSKWFYERTRGQYNIKLRSEGTSARKKQFQVQFPSNQKFVKTDLAKYENTWRLNPHEVKKGAQWNLKKLGKEISAEFEKNEDNFREPFYKDLIAKAILFKNSDSAIARSNWYKENKGLKAEVVTYAIAFVRKKLLDEGLDINLEHIYNNQSLSQSLTDEIVDVAKFLKAKITDLDFAGEPNPSEFCKKLQSWEKIQKLDYPLDTMNKEIDAINQSQKSEKEKDDKEEIKAGKQISDIQTILEIPGKEWDALINYFSARGYAEIDPEISLCRLCSQIHLGKKIPTDRQAKKVLAIREKAYKEDFEF